MQSVFQSKKQSGRYTRNYETYNILGAKDEYNINHYTDRGSIQIHLYNNIIEYSDL